MHTSWDRVKLYFFFAENQKKLFQCLVTLFLICRWKLSINNKIFFSHQQNVDRAETRKSFVMRLKKKTVYFNYREIRRVFCFFSAHFFWHTYLIIFERILKFFFIWKKYEFFLPEWYCINFQCLPEIFCQKWWEKKLEMFPLFHFFGLINTEKYDITSMFYISSVLGSR